MKGGRRMDKVKAGKLIKSARLGKGFTQSALAKRLNVTQGAIVQWETGKIFPKATNLVKVAKVLGIPVEKLLKAG